MPVRGESKDSVAIHDTAEKALLQQIIKIFSGKILFNLSLKVWTKALKFSGAV